MTTTQHVFVGGHVPRPENREHRRQLMLDAVATLDAAAIHTLIATHRANVNDVSLACEQADVDLDGLMGAYTAWLNEAAKAVRAADADRARIRIGQPTLLATAHSLQEDAH